MMRVINLHYRALRHYKRAMLRGDHMEAIMWLNLIDRQRVTFRNRARMLKQKHVRKSLRNNRKRGALPVTQPFNRAAKKPPRQPQLKAGGSA